MTQTLTTERQQFEEWFNEEIVLHISTSNEAVVRLMWKAWQASRELLANREAQPVALVDRRPAARGGICWQNGGKDLAHGTELFTAPPAPAVVKLPTEFYSDEGIVVRLEQVMSALAVVGIQYERKANAKTRCEFPSPEVPEEMTGGIAMSKYKVKKSNYAQWVKGWNACRAAMLAQPVSSGYKLPPHVYRELVNSLRDTAVKFSGTEQLRERLNTALSQFIEPDHPHTRTVAPEGGNG
ncbi:Uncharacterised protein [Serratia marcescens]|uniref:hypothetical protein n=1 Tax=Serratia marcescens TaxID=615 RepID=UPI000744E3F4|nr:hypothetical protein [Serratia marcescens]CUZ88148.1 Uncharacterised protein [Serratia marcescens]CVA50480.1 Uncharacterised protein [Serratia marcescens]CVA76916.1 Uncharacterised protein [Serratia marcescens]CVH15679.1 Uncharacterised protein [Serratia marcescens]